VFTRGVVEAGYVNISSIMLNVYADRVIQPIAHGRGTPYLAAMPMYV
jgi:hypothetical protein